MEFELGHQSGGVWSFRDLKPNVSQLWGRCLYVCERQFNLGASQGIWVGAPIGRCRSFHDLGTQSTTVVDRRKKRVASACLRETDIPGDLPWDLSWDTNWEVSGTPMITQIGTVVDGSGCLCVCEKQCQTLSIRVAFQGVWVG